MTRLRVKQALVGFGMGLWLVSPFLWAQEPLTQPDLPASKTSPEKGKGLNGNTASALRLEPVTYAPKPVLTNFLVKDKELPVGLPLVVELVREQNLPLASSRVATQIEGSVFGQTVGQMLPDINLSYTQSRFQGAVQIFGGQTISIFRTTIQPQASISWVVNPAGRDVWLARAQKFIQKAARANEEITEQQQLSLALQRYMDLLAAHLNLAVVEQTFQAAETQLRFDEARLKAGVAPKLDVMRSQARLAERKGEQVTAETLVAQAEQALLEVLNLDRTISLIPDVGEAVLMHWVPEPWDSPALVARAMENNPQLARLQEQRLALQEGRKAAIASAFPDVTLSAFVNRTGPRYGELETSRFGGFEANWNILDGLGTTRWFAIKEAKQREASILLQEETLLRQIETQLTQSLLNVRQQRQLIDVAQSRLAATQEAFRLAEGRFRAGVAIQLDVLNAEQDLLAAKQELIRSALDYNKAQIQLLEVMGQLTPPTILGQVAPVDANTGPAKSEATVTNPSVSDSAASSAAPRSSSPSGAS